MFPEIDHNLKVLFKKKKKKNTDGTVNITTELHSFKWLDSLLKSFDPFRNIDFRELDIYIFQ